VIQMAPNKILLSFRDPSRMEEIKTYLKKLKNKK